MMQSPAATMPCSGSSACSMPMRPTSKKFTMPCSRAKSRHSTHCSALLMSLLGTKWSMTRATLFLSKTLLRSAFLSSRIATGPVMSLASTRSMSASMSWPGTTSSTPACAARIFCVMVIPIRVCPFCASARVRMRAFCHCLRSRREARGEAALLACLNPNPGPAAYASMRLMADR